ncbi:MAG: hypothetical protein LBD50_00290 [Rickettsiales bacterium]|nr:hypothetical protein [Rickettsiales bacterium]
MSKSLKDSLSTKEILRSYVPALKLLVALMILGGIADLAEGKKPYENVMKHFQIKKTEIKR